MRRYHFLLFLIAGTSLGTTVRVPENYPTIQAALDAIEPGDSIVVYTMTHAEALIAPPFEFWLLGDVLPGDSGEYERPVIDPTSLPNSDSLACLIIPEACKPHIEDIKFVNGASMYPRAQDMHGQELYGGIVFRTADTVEVTRCIFDSTAGGVDKWPFIEANGHIRISQSLFRDLRDIGVRGFMGMEVFDCVFEGTTFTGIWGRGNLTVERCSFSGDLEWHWIMLDSDYGIIRDCIFGPGECLYIEPLNFGAHDFTIFENNLFNDMEVRGSMMRVGLRQTGITELRNNMFLNNWVSPQSPGATPIHISDASNLNSPTSRAIIAGNHFADNATAVPGVDGGKLIWLVYESNRCEISGNRFYNNSSSSAPVIQSDTSGSQVSVAWNLFQYNGKALRNDHRQIDARFNYWGDASGPYHDELNPDGMGDEVSGNVLFDPWYPDSSFLDTPLRTKPSVLRHQLQAFPNPFNANVTLRFEIPEPGIFRVELFDVLGRTVKEVFYGPIAYEKTIRFDGSALASGIYYARAWQTTHNRPVATTKLVLLK